jgi:hypothetical protein
MRINLRNCVVLAFAVALVGLSSTAVRAQVAVFSIDLSLTNFETGVARPLPESFATAKVACNFDDWAKTVNWGDGNTEQLTHTVQATLPGPTTPAGTYPIYSAHAYAKAGTYSATAQLNIHCSGDPPSHPGALRDTKSYTVTVFDRLPLNILTPSSTTVKRGSTVDFKAQTFADAPASGTRVDFTANQANVFGSGTLSVHSDIPTNSKTTTATLTVSPTARLGPVTVTATAGSSLTTTISIVP